MFKEEIAFKSVFPKGISDPFCISFSLSEQMAAITMSVNTFSKIPESDLSANKKPENAKRASGSSGSYTVSTSAARITFQSHKSRKEPILSKKPENKSNKNHKESQHRQLPNTDNLKSNFIVSKNPSYKNRMQISAGPLPPANGKSGIYGLTGDWKSSQQPVLKGSSVV